MALMPEEGSNAVDRSFNRHFKVAPISLVARASVLLLLLLLLFHHITGCNRFWPWLKSLAKSGIFFFCKLICFHISVISLDDIWTNTSFLNKRWKADQRFWIINCRAINQNQQKSNKFTMGIIRMLMMMMIICKMTKNQFQVIWSTRGWW